LVTILITNRKGGVGKTTTTTNLAAWLGSMGKKVLMIDLDTQGHLQYGFGFHDAFDSGVHDTLEDGTSLLSKIYETPYKNVHLIPAHVNYNISDIQSDNTRLKGLIEMDGIDKMFDICLIDTPPTSDILLYNALYMSDYTIVPIKAEFLGTIGVNQFLKLFYATASKVNQKIELLGLLPTMYNRSMKEHNLIISHLKKKVGEDRVFTPVRNDIKLSVSFLEGKPAIYYDRNTRGARDYKSVALQVLHKINLPKESDGWEN
jgi:chromosome partitioning protein